MSHAEIKAIVQEILKHAILYLRVSTPRQLDTAIDLDPEGNSIATQRVLGENRAAGLHAVVDKVFIEPGNSAQSIEKRPVFRELLAYLADHPEVEYVIVYMRSRAFRNAADAFATKQLLKRMGIKLISVKEDFGEGYIADAMEGMIDIFNELEVRRLSGDIKDKMRNKARNGGTISRAKLGYLNTRADHEGKLYNTISLDEDRHKLVLKVFELYATGDYSLDRLEATMADLGLTTRPSGRWPQEQPVSDSKLHQMLSDPYYAGWVTVDGELIQGRHPAIVEQPLFDRVQEVLAARSKGGNRDRILQHYLKGMLCCERCRKQDRISRLIYTEAKGRNGDYYGYFLCRSRQEGNCDLPHLPDWQVEDAIERNYRRLQLPEDFTEAVLELLNTTMADEQQLTRERHEQLTRQLAKLESREQRLIDLAADGLLNRSKILERSNAIQLERRSIEASLVDTSAELAVGAEQLRYCLELATDPGKLYANAPEGTKRQLNSTFYDRFFIDDDPLTVAHDELKPPFGEIHEANLTYQRYKQVTMGNRAKQPILTSGAINAAETNKRPNPKVGALEQLAPVLADVFPVSVSSRRVMVGVLGLEPRTNQL